MNRKLKTTLVAVAGVVLISTTTACSAEAPPDEIGLYYNKGSIEGYSFEECVLPGKIRHPVNDEVIFVPESQRTWNIAKEGGDSSTPIVVNGAPEENQPSGGQVSLWLQFAFTLNTDCGVDNKDPNSPLVQWWEQLGRRYAADTDDGWKNMLQQTIVSAAEAASRVVARNYQADVLVALTERDAIQQGITRLLQTELERLVGGDYFCAPSYNPRASEAECGGVVVLLKDADYTNANVQAARDEKQVAIERAAAQLIEAQAQVNAANELAQLYQNPAWLEYEKARLQYEAVLACAANPNCTIVIGTDGSIVNTTR